MNPDLLALKRQNENLIDRLKAAEKRIARLERVTAEVDDDGKPRFPALLLRVRTSDAPNPPDGYIAVYAVTVDGAEYLYAKNAAGIVRQLADWSVGGEDARVRDISAGTWWRLFIDVLATGQPHVIAEEIG